MKLRFFSQLVTTILIASFVYAMIAGDAHAQLATDAGPASAHVTITPNDTTSLLDSNGLPKCRALFINTGGNISITDASDVTIVYTVADSTILPFRPKRVNATGTTAGGIVCWRS